MLSEDDRKRFVEIMRNHHEARPRPKDCIIGALKGRAFLIDYYRTGKDSYVKSIRISDESDADLRSRGYKTGVHLLNGWEYLFTSTKHTYVRIHGFQPFDASTMGNFETSSTLMDWYHSDSEKQFTAHLVKIKMDPMDVRRLAIIGAGVLVGILGYFLLFGGM